MPCGKRAVDSIRFGLWSEITITIDRISVIGSWNSPIHSGNPTRKLSNNLSFLCFHDAGLLRLRAGLSRNGCAGFCNYRLSKMWRDSRGRGRPAVSQLHLLRVADSVSGSFGGSNSADWNDTGLQLSNMWAAIADRAHRKTPSVVLWGMLWRLDSAC